MKQLLAEHHQRIAAAVAGVRMQCALPSPDIAALSAARLRLSRASTARSRYVSYVVFPKLRAKADKSMLTQLSELQRTFAAKRLASSKHITTWTHQSIIVDWAGYRRDAERYLTMVEEHMAEERQLFR